MPIDETEVERDLTSKEINALTAVSLMLCESDSIVGHIKPEYVRKQLYHDKQESIPPQAIRICSDLINSLRRISLKKGDEASFLTCCKIRQVRNTLVDFAGDRTKFGSRKLFPEKKEADDFSVHINHATLYLLFQADHNMYNEDKSAFTSYQSIQNDQDKCAIFKNFLDWEFVERRLKEQNLNSAFAFSYTNQYDVHFLGKKNIITSQIDTIAAEGEIGMIDTPDHKVQTNTSSGEVHKIREEIKRINKDIKSNKNEYASCRKTLTQTEKERMDIGRKVRTLEKKEHRWDAELYNKLKKKRDECNVLSMRLQELQDLIKSRQSQMYQLNKVAHGQQVASTNNSIVVPQVIKSRLQKSRNVLVQGIDPGIVTTASSSCVKPSALFQSINRFECLQSEDADTPKHMPHKEYNFELTASKVNQALLFTEHRLTRERAAKSNKQPTKNDLDCKRVTRSIRKKRYYKKMSSYHRESMLKCHSISPRNSSLLSFVGNWSQVGTYIKRHTRRSIKPVLERLSLNNDCVCLVDEFRSTITCNSCYHVTTKQIIRTKENKKKRIKGAVVCSNIYCPRRISTRSTTVNRDLNGAKNIALIGFSQLVSSDNCPLPPFRRSSYNTNKYV